MATITVTRSLNEQGGTFDGALVSPFQRNSIAFNFDHGGLSNTSAGVEIGGYKFAATKVSTAGNIDSYILDVTEILPSILGLAPLSNSSLSDLIVTASVRCYGLNSAGVEQASSTANVSLCFGARPVGFVGGLDVVSEHGRSGVVYHDGKITYYHPNTSAFKSATTTTNGTFTDGSASFQCVYRAPKESHEIAWINEDGCWSYWHFRRLSVQNKTKWSNEIPVYALTNYEQKTKSVETNSEITASYKFDTIAIDTEHFRQLTYIGRSPRVLYDGRVYKVKDCSDMVADCKQNMKFSLTLEFDENGIGY